MSVDEDRVLLVEGANMVRIGLARDLLAEAGIPCVVEGPDFDVAELGRAAHDMIRGQSLYVPRSAFARAKEILDEAWSAGEVELDEDFDVGAPVEEPSRPPTPAARGGWGAPVTLGLLGLVLILGFLWLEARSTVARYEQGDPLFLMHFGPDRVTSFWRSTGELAQETVDADQNGTPEHVLWYDPQGVKVSEARDEDQDGNWDTVQHFDEQGRLYQINEDRDGDGRTDRATEFRRTGARIEWVDENRDGAYERRTVHDADGQVVRVEEDREVDGWVRVDP